jgi:tRNA threonylcarbamoyl adenosine modification protein YeaZ
MNTLYLERSTGDCRSGDWVSKLDLACRPDRIVVGTGPGSFAGIRSALAFAQGYAVGSGCEVLGLPSACALAEPSRKIAVVGDARRDKFWVALFDGFSLSGEIFQVGREALQTAVPKDYSVVTPDAARIDALLSDVFGPRYEGGRQPSAEGLRAFAEANPSVLVREPLPLYLNPAVRE